MNDDLTYCLINFDLSTVYSMIQSSLHRIHTFYVLENPTHFTQDVQNVQNEMQSFPNYIALEHHIVAQ